MANSTSHIQVFEHEKLHFHKDDPCLTALQQFYFEKGNAFYTLIHNGVKFKEYVGVIRVGSLTVEVLPKIDRSESDKGVWQKVLLDMLRMVGLIKVEAPTSAVLSLKSNSILDLYIELFVNEVAYLIKKGLVKSYRKKEGNQLALKGRMMFAHQIRNNLIHAERFYINYTTYDHENRLNQILYKTIRLLSVINTNSGLSGTISRLNLDFPELENVAVSDQLFERLKFNRKTEAYRNAIEIARLLLLNYHPDIQKGQNKVLAIMFDMNKLWESYILAMLRKVKQSEYRVRGQMSAGFWKPEKGRKKTIRPDIVLEPRNPESGLKNIVIDTKWKTPKNLRPSDADLKQMYVYNELFESKDSFLLYPHQQSIKISGVFLTKNGGNCGVIGISVLSDNNSKLDNLIGVRLWLILREH